MVEGFDNHCGSLVDRGLRYGRINITLANS